MPPCLSVYRASFVNSNSSVRVRPEAPICGRSSEAEQRDDIAKAGISKFSARTIYRYVCVNVTAPDEESIAVTRNTVLRCQMALKRTVVCVVSMPVD